MCLDITFREYSFFLDGDAATVAMLSDLWLDYSVKEGGLLLAELQRQFAPMLGWEG